MEVLAAAVSTAAQETAPPQPPAPAQDTSTDPPPKFRQITPEEVGPYRPRTTPDLDAAADTIITLTNKFRAEHKLPAVTPDKKLQAAAHYFADFMARTDKYGHEADGQHPAHRAQDHGYRLCIVSENIAFQFRTAGFTTDDLAKQLVEGWQKSPPHRQNMLDPHVTQIAVAVSQSDATHVFYAVQLFGRPESASIEFTVRNQTRSPVSYRVGEQQFELPPRYAQTHRLCRPAPLSLAKEDENENAPKFHPTAGDTFVIQPSRDGDVTLSRAPR